MKGRTAPRPNAEDAEGGEETTVPVSLSDSAYVELEMGAIQSDEETSERASKLLAERLTEQRARRDAPDYFRFTLSFAGFACWGLVCVWALNSATIPTPVSAPVTVTELLPLVAVGLSLVTLVAAFAHVFGISSGGGAPPRGGLP